MKLAEALILRADQQRRIEQLKQRLLRSATVQEGDKPAEEPTELIAELNRAAGDLVQLIQRINRTNVATELEPGVTIADAIAMRDSWRLKDAIYRELAQTATVTQDRYTKSEVKFKSSVNVAELCSASAIVTFCVSSY
jgi:hypothetical protein